jgi:Ca-activated chloride channel family protein
MSFLTVVEQFHFLRPWWLLAILPAILLGYYFWQQKNSAANWHGAIDSRLLDHLIEGGSTKTARWPWILLLISWLIAALAMAGPSWKKLPQPILQKQDALIIVLDLSRSMFAEDIQPSRLIRARHKVLDILNNRKEGLTALIAYAGDSHIVSPLTDDNPTIANLAPALSPDMMPLPGSDPVSALKQASDLFINAGVTSGRVLLISDGISTANVGAIDNSLIRNGYQLSILGIGTVDGAPIPTQQGFLKDSKGNIVVPQLKRSHMEQLAELNDGRYTDVSLTDDDIQFLLANSVTDSDDNTVLTDRQFDQWHDRGPLLAILLLPLALLGFRRGWLLLLPLFMLFEPQASYALEWQDLWKTADQQAAEAWQQGDMEAASQQFKDPQWQASAQYKNGDFKQAAESFASNQSAAGHYNRGNALAKDGQLDKAISAYEEALKLQPNMEDAQANKALVEQLKQQQEQQQSEQESSEQEKSDQNDSEQSDQQQEGNDQQNSDDKNSEQESKEQSEQQQQNDQQSDNSDEEQQSQAEQQAEDSEENDDKQQEQQQAEQQESDNQPEKKQPSAAEQAELTEEQKQQQQVMEQWLRKIPDDPSGLLRRKFNYEYRVRQQRGETQEEGTQW